MRTRIIAVLSICLALLNVGCIGGGATLYWHIKDAAALDIPLGIEIRLAGYPIGNLARSAPACTKLAATSPHKKAYALALVKIERIEQTNIPIETRRLLLTFVDGIPRDLELHPPIAPAGLCGPS